MDYKEKYEQALEKAAALYKASEPMSGCNVIIETLFPELKESEDERIRKALIDYFNDFTLPTFEGLEPKKILAWLEKQGDANKEYWRGYREGKQEILDKYAELEKQGGQKSADKVEPKFNFKVGQWIVATGKCVYLITKIDGFNITLVDTNGDEYVFDVSSFDDAYQWTIEDAKNGDVLAEEPIEGYSSSFVAIYKKRNEEDFDSYCFVGFDGYFYEDERGHSTENIHPATKEQRDLLFQKIKESGYEWDSEKKELKKIEQKHTEWSEEDEEMFEYALDMIEWYSGENEDKSRLVSVWLKSIKGRIQPQPKLEWNKEDEDILNTIINHFEIDLECTENDDIIKWLKSLKPQNRWKPSEEQIKVLEKACDEHWEADGLDPLCTLYKDLKKLREE